MAIFDLRTRIRFGFDVGRFAHRGTIVAFDDIRERLSESLPDFLRRNIRGQTDSEYLFHAILSFVHDAGQLDNIDNIDVADDHVLTAMSLAIALVTRLSAEVGHSQNTLTSILTNGRSMFALCDNTNLAYVEREGLHETRDDYTPPPQRQHTASLRHDRQLGRRLPFRFYGGRNRSGHHCEPKPQDLHSLAIKTMETNEARVVLCTMPNKPVEQARRFADTLIESKLAACVNIVPNVKSVYRWEGKTENEEEILLIIKSTEKRIAQLTEFIEANHPYDVPEVICLSVESGSGRLFELVDGFVELNLAGGSQRAEQFGAGSLTWTSSPRRLRG